MTLVFRYERWARLFSPVSCPKETYRKIDRRYILVVDVGKDTITLSLIVAVAGGHIFYPQGEGRVFDSEARNEKRRGKRKQEEEEEEEERRRTFTIHL
jgi:hypothetical protein